MYLDTPVNEYMRSVLTNSLGKRGIEVAAPAKYSIRGSIKELWISEDNGFIAEFSKCDMKIEFTIVSSKTLQHVYEGTANSQIYGTNYSIETTDSNGPALKSCIDGFAEQLIQNSGVQKILNLKVL